MKEKVVGNGRELTEWNTLASIQIVSADASQKSSLVLQNNRSLKTRFPEVFIHYKVFSHTFSGSFTDHLVGNLEEWCININPVN